MSQVSGTRQGRDANTAGEPSLRNPRLYSFRSKWAQRLALNPKARACETPEQPEIPDSRANIPGVSYRSMEGIAPTRMTQSPSQLAHTNANNSHSSHPDQRLSDHLRCAECHNLGQLMGEVTLSSGTLTQRQNDTIYNLKMLIRDASAALESTIECQEKQRYLQGDLKNKLECLTESCPGCIILSGGITRPTHTADLTDETPLRENLAHLVTSIEAGKLSAGFDTEAVARLESVGKWLVNIETSVEREDTQRLHLRNELSTLEATIVTRQAPFIAKGPTDTDGPIEGKKSTPDMSKPDASVPSDQTKPPLQQSASPKGAECTTAGTALRFDFHKAERRISQDALSGARGVNGLVGGGQKAQDLQDIERKAEQDKAKNSPVDAKGEEAQQQTPEGSRQPPPNWPGGNN